MLGGAARARRRGGRVRNGQAPIGFARPPARADRACSAAASTGDRARERADPARGLRRPRQADQERAAARLGIRRCAPGGTGVSLLDELADDVFEQRLLFRLHQPALLVELLLCVGERQLAMDYTRAGGTEHLAQLGLGPDGAEHRTAGSDHRRVLAADRRLIERARGPIDRILELSGNRAVVLGRREQQAIGSGELGAQVLDRSAGAGLVVLVERRHCLQAVEADVLDVCRQQPRGRFQQTRVMRAAAQAPGDPEDAHRCYACFFSSSSTLSVTSLATTATPPGSSALKSMPNSVRSIVVVSSTPARWLPWPSSAV